MRHGVRGKLVMALGFLLAGGACGLAADKEAPESVRTEPRSRDAISSELNQLDQEYKTLTDEENEVLARMKREAEAIRAEPRELVGNDTALMELVSRLRDLEEQVKVLREEIRVKVAANPVLNERRDRLAQNRQRLMELQRIKMEKIARRKALLDERDAAAAPPAVPESAPK